MPPDTETEDALRALLRQVAGSSGSEAMIDTSKIIRGARRARRRRSVLQVAGGLACVVLIGGLALSWPYMLSQHTGNPIDHGRDTHRSIFSWAQNLPEGPAPSVPYLVGGILHVDGSRVRVDGTRAGLIGPVATGQLLLVEHEQHHPYRFSSSLQIYTASGRTATLPPSKYQAQDEVIDPTGTRVAYGSQVYDLTSGDFVDDLPANAKVLEGWSAQGLLYADQNAGYWLWQPGHQPAEVRPWPGGELTDDGAAIRNAQAGCSRLNQLSPNGAVNERFTACGVGDLLAISPTTNVFTSHLKVLNANGDVIASFPPPGSDLQLPPTPTTQALWETASTILFTTAEPAEQGPSGDVSAGQSTLIVRCSLQTESCQRAGSALEVTVKDVIQFEQ